MPGDILQFVGPNQAVQLFGVKLLGFNAENGKKLVFTLVFIVFALLLSAGAKKLVQIFIRGEADDVHQRFWTTQGIKVFTAALLIVGIASIWFDDPTRLTTAAGMVTAGLAFALQRVVTAVSGYFVILRGDVFSVGDRIVMGGVRGDVIGLSFTQTTIMEMGQSPAEQGGAPSMWIRERQYTGRIVNVSNARIFDDPVYNYTREFPFIWDEMLVPIGFEDDQENAERILLEVAERHTARVADHGEEALRAMERRYFMKRDELKPRVYWRLTGDFVEMTVRFVVEEGNSRRVMDRISRDILDAFREAGIKIATATQDISSLPPVRVQLEGVSQIR